MAPDVGKSLVIVMAMGTFVVVLDNTIMNVSISALVADLQTTVSGVQAAIALNALMMAAFVLMGGKMADILGMKRTFLGGALFYVAGSLLASFSNNLAVFILGWCAIQGFGAAMMLPNVNTIIRAYIAGKERVKVYGLMGGINAMAMAVGPIIGGFLTTYFSWRWAFRLEVAVLLGVFLMSRSIPKDVMGAVKPVLDKIGVIWQAAAMVLFVLGTLLIADYGLIIAKQPLVIAGYEFAPLGLSIVPFLYGAAVICLIQFVHWEQHLEETGRDRLIDLVLFGIGDFVQGLDVRFIQVALVAGTTFVVPLFLQVTYGISAFETGFILLGLTAGLLVTAMSGSKRALAILPKRKVALGFLIAITGAYHDRVHVRRRGPRGPDARPVCVRPGNRPGCLADREPDHVGGDARADCGGVGDRVNRGDPGERGGDSGDRHDPGGGADQRGGDDGGAEQRLSLSSPATTQSGHGDKPGGGLHRRGVGEHQGERGVPG